MPTLPAYRCSEPGCGHIAAPRHDLCVEHIREREARHNATEQRAVYRSVHWRRLRAAILRAEPMCRAGCGRRATDIDHVEPLRAILARFGDPYDTANLAPLCHEDHALKTSWEQGRIDAPPWVGRIAGIPEGT